MATNAPHRPGIDAFHRERSRCLDAFSALEETVIELLRLCDAKCGAEPLGPRIEALRKARPSPRYAKAHKERVNAALAQIEDLLDLRNDLVHARLQIALIGEEQKACFINNRHRGEIHQTARLLSLDGLRAVTRQAGEIAEALRPA